MSCMTGSTGRSQSFRHIIISSKHFLLIHFIFKKISQFTLHILYRHGISNQLFNNLTVSNQINQ